jgi:hypothetical protein
MQKSGLSKTAGNPTKLRMTMKKLAPLTPTSTYHPSMTALRFLFNTKLKSLKCINTTTQYLSATKSKFKQSFLHRREGYQSLLTTEQTLY